MVLGNRASFMSVKLKGNPQVNDKQYWKCYLCLQESPQGSFLFDALPSDINCKRQSHDDQDEEPTNDSGCNQWSSANQNKK